MKIDHIVKWFKTHSLGIISKYIFTCLFLPKTMVLMKYDSQVHFAIVQWRCFKKRIWVILITN